MVRYRTLIASLVLVFAGVVLVLYCYNPSTSSFYPLCLFHSVTGLHCAGCGGLRAAHALLHGNVAESFAYNPLLIMVAPCFLVVALGIKCHRILPFFASKPEMYNRIRCFTPVVVITVIGYTILRNLPFPPFCHLAPH